MYLVFDIGGTKMRVATSRDGERLEKTAVVETPVTYETGIAELKKIGATLASGEPVLAVAGGIAGPYSQKKEALVGSPNLNDWIGRPFRAELETFFNAPAYVENDAMLAGLGEAHRGGGRGFEIVAYITVSTGVGGARIVSGKIDEKSVGFEPGHQIIDADQTMVPLAAGPFLGDMISGKALTKLTGKKPKDISDPKLWDSLAHTLAYGLNNLCVFWSPDVIVLGGMMITGSPAIPLAATEMYLKKIMSIYPSTPTIKMAELGDFGGLHGGLEYIRLRQV